MSGKKLLFSLCAVALFVACSEEKSEPLPDLPPVEIPKDVPGLYSGRLPCDDCTSRMVRMTLSEDSSVVATQLTLRDTMVTDTLRGTYVVTDSTIKISLSDNQLHWNFKRIKFGNLRYMTSAGVPYEDKDGLHADFIRIYKAPLKPVARNSAEPDSSAEQKPVTTDSSKE